MALKFGRVWRAWDDVVRLAIFPAFSSIDTAQVADKLGDSACDCGSPLGGGEPQLQIGAPRDNTHVIKNRAHEKTSVIVSNSVDFHQPCIVSPSQLVDDALAVGQQQFDTFVSQLLSEKLGVSANQPVAYFLRA